MAARPWITTNELISYSDFPDVQSRAPEKLSVDIKRSEASIISYCKQDFSTYETIPDDIKTADLLLAEYFAHNAQAIQKAGAKQSETFDDYSYSIGTSDMSSMFTALGIDVLLNAYVVSDAAGSVFLRLRKL